MPSSKLRGPTAFKPTPSTCYPPPPPPVDPGFIPCFGFNAPQLAILRLTTTVIDLRTVAQTRHIDVQSQVANVTNAPTAKVWAATLTGQQAQSITLSIGCYNTGYFGWRLLSQFAGRLRCPDGAILSGSDPLAPPEVVPNPPGLPSWAITWQQINGRQWTNGTWQTGPAQITLYFPRSTPQSRPPQPMIPQLA